MTLLDVEARAAGGKDHSTSHAPHESGRKRDAQEGDGQQRGCGMVRGDRKQLRDSSRRCNFPTAEASRSPLVDRRRRPVPRYPGQWRHDLADGRRLAARQGRLAARAGRPRDRGGPRGRPQLRLPRLRRYGLGVDSHRARHSRVGSSPIGLSTAEIRIGPALRTSRSSSGPTIARRRKPRATCGPSRRRRFCRPARHSSRGRPHATSARLARSGFVVTLDDPCAERELIPLAGVPGARVEMHLRYATHVRRQDSPVIGAGRGWGRQSRSARDSEHSGLRSSSRRPASAGVGTRYSSGASREALEPTPTGRE